MASILDRYGIKEVADVTFYEIGSDGKPTNPVLYLDTLKVSTIEQTGEETTANGGKGNAALIMWDYNKEINVTLEDALFSAKSLAIMFGDGQVKKAAVTTAGGQSEGLIMKTEVVEGTATPATVYTAPDGKAYAKINGKFFTPAGASIESASRTDGEKYFYTYDLKMADVSVITINANSFPGTYYITGDTYARSETTGKDEFFQFIIPKAKVLSENTITLEAEGDPSVFNMNLRVLRAADGGMMKLVKYSLADGTAVTEATSVEIPHNHVLNPVTSEG